MNVGMQYKYNIIKQFLEIFTYVRYSIYSHLIRNTISCGESEQNVVTG